MKAVVAAFNQEKALVGAFSVITNLRMELYEALVGTQLGHAARIQAQGQYLNNNTETCVCVPVCVVSYCLHEVQQAQARAGQWAPR